MRGLKIIPTKRVEYYRVVERTGGGCLALICVIGTRWTSYIATIIIENRIYDIVNGCFIFTGVFRK